jgi:hypothetical protein
VTFNDADRFLLDHWSDAKDLEDGMSAIRTKYEQVLNEVAKNLQDESWWESDFQVLAKEHYGCIGFGRKSWGGKKTNYPGLWLDDLDLDYLTGRLPGHPHADLWLGGLNLTRTEWEDAGPRIIQVAGSVLSDFPPRSAEADITIVRYSFPETRDDLLKGLLTDSSKLFISTCCGHLNRLARLIPAIDQVLGKRKLGKV